MKEKVQSEVREDLRKSTYSEVLGVAGAEGCSTRPKYSAQLQNEDVLEKATKEVQGRMDRKNNIVMYWIPEQVSDDMDLSIREEKIRHDKLIFIDLCGELGITCYESDIEEIRRIGKYGGESGSAKPRPILVTLRGCVKERIMRNLYKLKNSKKKIFAKVGISHDMTKEERKKDIELKEEAKKRKEDEQSSRNYYVVRGSPWNRYILKVKRRQ